MLQSFVYYKKVFLFDYYTVQNFAKHTTWKALNELRSDFSDQRCLGGTLSGRSKNTLRKISIKALKENNVGALRSLFDP